MANAPRDNNRIPTLLGTSNVDGTTPVVIYGDPVTHRLLVDATGGVSFADAETPTGAVNGSNVTFTLANSPSPAASLILIADNQPQAPVGVDYTLSGATITMNIAPQNWVLAYYRY